MPKTLSELSNKVGVAFLVVISTVYFAQGFRTLAQLAFMSYLKDVLQLEPAASQALMSTAALPWSIKPIYGLLSDYFPIFGKRRKPYLVIAGVLGTVSWVLISHAAAGTGENAPSPWFIMVLFGVGNLSTAISDVVVDAMVAEKSHSDDPIEDDLQSLCWKCMAVGGVFGSLLGPVDSILEINIKHDQSDFGDDRKIFYEQRERERERERQGERERERERETAIPLAV